MWNAFKQIPGIESGHLVPHGDLNKFGTWDLHFEADWGEDALKGVLPYEPVAIPKPSAFWHSDTHLGYEWRRDKALRTDWNFIAQIRAVEDFKKEGIQNVFWMPHAVEPMAYPYIPSIKKYDLCFIGHINSQNRIDALDRMFKEFPKFFYGQRLFEAAAEKFCQSKIVFNITIKDDINMRTFEALSTKSFLLTNYIPTLGELFEDGKHLVMYKDLDEAVDKAKYYITHNEEREKIAEAGFQEVRAKHTFKHRCEQVLKTVGLWDKLQVPAAV
jgi:spore maturation protein CgeB